MASSLPRQLLLPLDRLSDRPLPVPGAIPPRTGASLRPRAIWQTLSPAHRASVRQIFVQMAQTILPEVHADG